MSAFETNTGINDFRLFPGFCQFILEQQLEAFVISQLQVSREIDLPILKRLSHFTDQQLVDISKISMTEYLGFLAQNKAKELVTLSLERWVADQLEHIGKFELSADDITMIGFIRSKSFRKFIPLYTTDINAALELADEIDGFITYSNTAATDTYISILKDVIEKHEKELLEAQAIAHIGSFEWDMAGNNTKNSPEIYSIFEIDPGLGYSGFMEFVHPDDKAAVAENITNALQTGAYEAEYRFVKNGKTKYIWSKGKVSYEEGKPVKMIGTVQDVTERKKNEQALLEKTVALERSNESLQQFAFVASHDLKEPLRKIATYTDMVLLKENTLSEASQNILKKVYASSARLRQMIDDIMSYSTLTQWEDRATFSLQTIVKEACELLEQNIEEKKATIIYHHLPEVHVVGAQFRQLFQNLISNGLKFSLPGVMPCITITHQWLSPEAVIKENLVAAEKYLQVNIKDNGIGFNEEFINKIFTLFGRLHRKTEYEGSGLGLAIAKRIVDNHGGFISAHSSVGQGATFYFIIPQ